jgi:molecular chaperone GrpE
MKKQKEEQAAEEAEAPDAADTDSEAVEAEEAADAAVEAELEHARCEAAKMKEHYLRAVADLENFRKRIGREKQEIIRSAAAGVIEEMLPVLDNMKIGLEAADQHPEAGEVTKGFRMVYEQMKQALAQQGLEEILPDGEAFDPNLHDCIAHQPSGDVAEDHVMTTIRPGFRLNDRLIRAASVIVSSGPAPAGGGEAQSAE